MRTPADPVPFDPSDIAPYAVAYGSDSVLEVAIRALQHFRNLLTAPGAEMNAVDEALGQARKARKIRVEAERGKYA